mgnify:CR=1 FL=1
MNLALLRFPVFVMYRAVPVRGCPLKVEHGADHIFLFPMHAWVGESR